MNDTEASIVPSKPAQPSGSESPRRSDQPDGPPRRDDKAEHGDGSEDTTDNPREIGGRKGPDPVRYGDWEKNGRCIDF